MKTRLLVPLALALAAPAAAQTSDDAPHAVAQAEQVFAADAAEHGWAWAFRRHHAPGALVLQPDPIPAEVTLARVDGDGGTNLLWRPVYAGASLSGDLGFTTGPFNIRGNDRVVGHYFTVWQLQPNGTWRWIFDAGTDVVDEGGKPDGVQFLPKATEGVGSAEAAIAAVAAIEDGEGFAPQAHIRADTRVNRVGASPAIGREAASTLLASDGTQDYRTLVRRGSSAGDLVFSMGDVRDTIDGAERQRYFARIWQFGSDGWRLVFDEIVPRRE